MFSYLGVCLDLFTTVDCAEDGSMIIYSINEEISNLEYILINNLKLEYIILSLSITTFNIFFIRYLVKNYKDYNRKIGKQSLENIKFNGYNFPTTLNFSE
jgi:uncharacterized protein YacL